VVIVYSSMRTI